jgi:hypothetical protein
MARLGGFELREAALPARFSPSASASVTAAATTASATAEVAASGRLGTGLVHDECTSFHLELVQLVDGALRIVVGRHFDKRKSARAAGGLIAHHADVVDCSRAAEQLRELFVRALVR